MAFPGSWLRPPRGRRRTSTSAAGGTRRPSPSYAVAVEAGPPVDLGPYLVALRDAYVESVNCAVAEGRLDLVRQLVDDYTDEALTAIIAAPRVA